MCGLIAMFTAEKTGFVTADKDELKQMMVINSLRGVHSTGLAGVKVGAHKPHIIKSIGSPYALFNYNVSNQFFDKMVASYNCIIGHGRYATKGEISAPNAHPFVEGHITLAHNGVINNYWQLRDHVKHKDIDVDSHLIARMISEEGALNVLPRVTGAYVFIWYDSEEETFNIARNEARPLYGIKQTNKDTLTFASEYQTLLWNGDRNRTPYDDVFEITPMQIYSFSKDSLDPVIYPYEIEKPVYVAPIVTHKPAVNSSLSQVKVGDYTLKLNNEYTFVVEDIESSGKGYFLVRGYSTLYPKVVFRASFRDITEEDLYSADFVRGTLVSIFPCRSDDVGNEWQVFLMKPEIIVDEVSTKVTVENFNGGVETMAKFRLVQLADKGCTWCTCDIPESDLETPIKAQIFSYGESGQSLVCSKCVEQSLVGSKT